MCTLAAWIDCHPSLPILVAANRDEFLSRPATGPQLLANPPRLVAGVDLVAGGTWLGINGKGLVAAVLNRRTGDPPDVSRRSRGSLCLEALGAASLHEAERRVLTERPVAFNPCILFLAQAGGEAIVLMNETTEWRRVLLGPGLHVLTNRPIDDVECPRRARAFVRFSPVLRELKRGWSVHILDRLREGLADHVAEGDESLVPPQALCVHLPGYGTRTATVILVTLEPAGLPCAYLWGTEGPPCVSQFQGPRSLTLSTALLDSAH